MEHLWVVLSVVSAFSLATSDACAKKAVEQGNEYLVAWLRLVFTLPVLLPALILAPVPRIGNDFLSAFLTALPVELVTIVLYIKALKASPLNLTLPFLALTPVFLIFNSYVILGEEVSLSGAAGILLIASGSYTLHIHEIRKGLFEPFRAIAREKGSVYMIIVAFLYSITSSYGKLAIENSTPLFFGSTYFLAVTLVFTPVGLWKGRAASSGFLRDMRKGLPLLISSGLFYAVMVVTHMEAMKLAKVAYMISLKRLSLLIGVVYGAYFFREERLGSRAIGALIMFAGFVMIVFAE